MYIGRLGESKKVEGGVKKCRLVPSGLTRCHEVSQGLARYLSYRPSLGVMRNN